MTNCKKFEDMIVFYDGLSPRELESLKTHLSSCEHCREKLNQQRAILASIKTTKNQGHLEDDFLSRYVTYLYLPDDDFDGTALSNEEVYEIETHIKHCGACTEKLVLLKNEFEELQLHLDEAGIPDLTINAPSLILSIEKFFIDALNRIIAPLKESLTRFKGKYILIPAAGLAALFILFMIIPFRQHITNDYEALASLEKTQISFLTRSRDTGALRNGLFEFNEGNYPAAMAILEDFIERKPGDPNIAFAEYVCGLACLYRFEQIRAERDYADQLQMIDRGIRHLQNMVGKTDNLRLREDANWYLGKAYLMKKQGRKAKQYFQEVVKLQGRKFKQTQQILIELEKLLISGK